jgi:hypothetical protein
MNTIKLYVTAEPDDFEGFKITFHVNHLNDSESILIKENDINDPRWEDKEFLCKILNDDLSDYPKVYYVAYDMAEKMLTNRGYSVIELLTKASSNVINNMKETINKQSEILERL